MREKYFSEAPRISNLGIVKADSHTFRNVCAVRSHVFELLLIHSEVVAELV
jgi:hypothetical protein